jgi:type II secretory pathway component PulF
MYEINHDLIEQIYNALNRVASKQEKKTAKANADAMMGETEKQTPIEKHRNQVENFCGTALYFMIAQQEQQREIIEQNKRIIELLERRGNE